MQDQLSPAPRLAIGAGAILPSQHKPLCPKRKTDFFYHKINPLLTKLIWSRYWPCSFFFCMCIDLDSVSVRKHNIVKQKLGQRPATLTSHLVNNLYTNCAVLENIHNPYKQLMYAPMVTDSKGAGLYQMLYKLEFSNAWDLKP